MKRIRTRRERKLVCIVGPTASGKSHLAVRLARKFNGEIISADSRQVYKYLNIGTGKITKKEMQGIPHHLLDVIHPKQQFTVVEYQKKAERALENIWKRGRLPIIVGGTGFYIDSLVNRVLIPEVKPNKALRRRLERSSTEQLFKLLQNIDPERAKKIDSKNKVRLIRAIEIAKTLGYSPEFKTNPRPALWIGFRHSKEELKKRIHRRLKARVKNGLFNEVRKLHEKQGISWRKMDVFGLEYRYVSYTLRGLKSRKEALEKLEREIYQYAKRQLTWFKNKNIHWISNSQEAVSLVKQYLKNTPPEGY